MSIEKTDRQELIYQVHTLGHPLLSMKVDDNEADFDDAAPVIFALKSFIPATGAHGMAANQLGFNSRICVIRLKSNELCVMINPKIVSHSTEIDEDREACFSLPTFGALVGRYREIEVRYDDEFNERRKTVFCGDEARWTQHEIDHLDGILICDKMAFESGASKLKRINRVFKSSDYTYEVSELGELTKKSKSLFRRL